MCTTLGVHNVAKPEFRSKPVCELKLRVTRKCVSRSEVGAGTYCLKPLFLCLESQPKSAPGPRTSEAGAAPKKAAAPQHRLVIRKHFSRSGKREVKQTHSANWFKMAYAIAKHRELNNNVCSLILFTRYEPAQHEASRMTDNQRFSLEVQRVMEDETTSNPSK